MTKEQLAILLWKNFCIRRCRLCHSIWEIFSGIVIFAIIFLVKRTLVQSREYWNVEDIFKEKRIPHSDRKYCLMGSIIHEINLYKSKIGDVNTSEIYNTHTKYLYNLSTDNITAVMRGHQNIDLVSIRHFVLLCTIMAPLPFYLYKVATLVDEKRTGMKHIIKLSGVSDHIWSLSHLIDTIVMGIIYSILVTILFKIQLDYKPILQYSHSFIIAFTILLHFVNVSNLAFITSSISQDYQHAEGWAIMLYLLFILINTWWFSCENKTFVHLYILGWILPHGPMCLFWIEIIRLEHEGSGLDFSNIWHRHCQFCVPVYALWLFSFLHFGLVMTIAWYLDNVRPGQYGVAKDWSFIFGKNFWREKQRRKKKVTFHVTSERTCTIVKNSKYFQLPQRDTEVAVKVVNLNKVFKHKRESVEALKNINLEVYKGQITILLGPNEGGKSTLLSIIAGMYSATSGTVYVNGLDMATRSYEVSKDLGLCPEKHNTFKYLTIEQNVMFFDMLKGTSKNEAKVNAQRLMIDLRINHKAQYYSHQLSNGMRRCLQVACAISGGAEILVLDEPTTGMDYDAKHSLWDVLLLLRGNKTILMATTCIEEADALGDSIAVMNGGMIRCHGSTMFLKDAIGVGLNLTVSYKETANESEIFSIFDKIDNSELKFVDDNVLAVTLPTTDLALHEDIFAEIDRRKDELGIKKLYIGMSLVEMYLRFIQDDNPSTVAFSYCNEEDIVLETELLKGFKLRKQQFFTLLHRNVSFICSKKLQFLILQLLSPMIGIMFITLATNNVLPEINRLEYRRDIVNLTLGEEDNTDNQNMLTLPKAALLMYLWILYICLLLVLPMVPSVWISAYEFKSTIRFSHITLGCPAWLHWFCKFLTDYLLFLTIAPPTVMLSCYYLDYDDTINHTDYMYSLLICITAYGPAFLVHMYCLSYILTNKNSISQIYIIIISFTVIVKVIVDLFTHTFIRVLLSLLSPIYTFSNLISIISWVARFNAFCNLNHHLCPDLEWNEEPVFSSHLCCDNEHGTLIYSYFPSNFLADTFLFLLLIDFIIYSVVLYQLQNRNLFILYNHIRTTIFDYAQLYNDQNVEYEKYYVAEKIAEMRMTPPGEVHADVLLVSNLHKHFTGLAFGTKNCYAIRGVNFSVKKGTCLVLLGCNGAGKTAVLNLIAGNTTKCGGTIFANGYFIDKNRAKYLKTLSVSLGKGSLDDFKSAYDNLVCHAKLYGMTPEAANKQAMFWLRYMGVTSHLNKPLRRLSAGCMGRVKLAAVLMTSRNLVLLDEPVEVQDVVAKMYVTRALRHALKKKIAIVVATQTMNWGEIEQLSDRMAILHSGEMAAIGTVEQIKAYYASGYVARIKLKLQSIAEMPKELSNLGLDRVRSDCFSRVNDLRNAFVEEFPNCALLSDHLRILYYHIKMDPEVDQFSQIFRKMQRLMTNYSDVFVDYTINELTMDETLAQFQKPHF